MITATANDFVEIEEVYYEDSNDRSNDVVENEDFNRKKLKRKCSTDETHHDDMLAQTATSQSQSIEDKLFCSSVACTLNKLSRVHNIKAKCEIYKVLEKYIELEER